MTELRAKALTIWIFVATADVLVWILGIMMFSNEIFGFNIGIIQALAIYLTNCIFRYEKIITAEKPLPIAETMRGIVFLVIVIVLRGLM